MTNNTRERINKLTKQKTFEKAKKLVSKRYPGAHIRLVNGLYEVCNKNGFPIRTADLYMPENYTARDAWERLAHSLWFGKMVVKSFNAFNDDKLFKKVVKENKDDNDE
jgi:hypothetical protein